MWRRKRSETLNDAVENVGLSDDGAADDVDGVVFDKFATKM